MPITSLHRFGPEDLNPDEVIIYRARLNFIAFLIKSWLGFFLVVIGFGILLASYVYRARVGFLIDETITIGIILLVLLFILGGGYHFFLHLLDWIYDEGVITSQRVIDYNQKALFSDELATANMRSVESIIVDQEGVIRTFFNYGTLRVETSGKDFEQSLLLADISKPKQVQRLIDEVSNRVKKEVNVDREEVLKVCGLG